MGTTEARNVNLSQYHAGQIVTPFITERPIGRGRLEIVIGWHDRSDDSVRSETIRGSVRQCQRAITAAGIHTDDNYSRL